jgi:NitT/TauT family transport system substrate-binding protein
MPFKIGAAIVAVACAAIVSPSFAQTAAPEKTDVSIAVGGKTFMIYLPLSVTERLGYFKDAGLNVEIQEVNSGTKSAQALVGGSVDATAGSLD